MSKLHNYKEITPRELLYAIGGCIDLRLFHVELREIHVTLEKIILRKLFCVIAYMKLSHSPRKKKKRYSSGFFLRK